MLEALDSFVPLKEDKSRLSLEGVMVATGLGVVLMYLVQEAQAGSYFNPESAKEYQDGLESVEGAYLGSRQGKIVIDPLDNVDFSGDQSIPLKENLIDSIGGTSKQNKNNFIDDAQFNGEVETIKRNSDPAPRSSQASRSLDSSINELALSPNEYLDGGPVSPPNEDTQENRRDSDESLQDNSVPTTNAPDQEEVGDKGRNVPVPLVSEDVENLPEQEKARKSIIVVLKTDNTASSQSVEGISSLDQTLSQIGIDSNNITFSPFSGMAVEIFSDQRGQFSARAIDNQSSIDIDNKNIGSFQSEIWNASDVIINANDWTRLNIDSQELKLAFANQVTAADQTQIYSTGERSFVNIQSNSDIEIWVPEGSRLLSQEIQVIASALVDSTLNTSQYDDVITIASNITGNINQYSLLVPQNNKSNLDSSSEEPPDDISIEINSHAISNSAVDTGYGNDYLLITATIDPEMASDMAAIASRLQGEEMSYKDNPQPIASINSYINMGAGDDYLSVKGDIVNSIIDMGSGRNQLIIEGNVDEQSAIQLGGSGSSVEYRSDMNGFVKGGQSDENFVLNKSRNMGYLDGGGGSDTLQSRSGMRKIVSLTSDNEGSLEGVRFKDIENIDLGPGNDVTLMNFSSSLTGQLLGGEGLDRLDYTNWSDAVYVDLDAGIATGFQQGIAGFEEAVGGEGNDFLAASGSRKEIDGGGGDDILFHIWSPWLSESEEGVALYGNEGEDIFVFAGLNEPIPNEWNQRSGLPVIKDLDFSINPANNRYNDAIGFFDLVQGEEEGSPPFLQVLTPSNLDGLGDATRLPISTIDKLLLGAENTTREQLVIGRIDENSTEGTLYLLGGSYAEPVSIAHLESARFS